MIKSVGGPERTGIMDRKEKDQAQNNVEESVELFFQPNVLAQP